VTVSLEETDTDLSSYFSSVVRSMNITGIDESLALGPSFLLLLFLSSFLYDLPSSPFLSLLSDD